jgi:hypothetical protein
MFCSYWTIQQNGEYVQQYYYLPRDMLLPANELVLIDELGVVDISQITVATVTVQIP